MLTPIEIAIKNALDNYQAEKLYLAYSGGVDSQVLLHALVTELKYRDALSRLTVCHIHHGLSDNADKWMMFARQQCQIFGVTFKCVKVCVDNDSGLGIEAKARELRYQALIDITAENDVIFTGHHENDQVETFLLALKRGSGLMGLSAMSEERDLSGRKLVRPLLNVSREQIETYAKQYQLQWVEDESNQNIDFDRNFLRQNVLPLLTERWPSINSAVVRSAEHCRDAQALLDEISREDYLSIKGEDNCLDCNKLNQLSPARFNQLIRYWLKQDNLPMPSQRQLDALRAQITADNDKVPQVKLGDVYFRRYQQRLYLTPRYQDVSNWQHVISIKKLAVGDTVSFVLPDNIGQVNIQKLADNADIQVNERKHKQQIVVVENSQDLLLSFTHNNPTCLPDYRNKSRSLKKILQELEIAPWLRKRQLFIYQNEQLLAAAGKFVCQPFTINQVNDKRLNESANCLLSIELKDIDG